MTNYKNLIVWQKSMYLCEEIYKITSYFPKEELYWIVSQIRRSSISIPSNIAEWYWRLNKKEYRQFLWIAKWSCNELETQFILSKNLWLLKEEDFNKIIFLIEEILKILVVIIKKLD